MTFGAKYLNPLQAVNGQPLGLTMVELCVLERISWTTLVCLTAIMAMIPRLHGLSRHGKLLGRKIHRKGLASWLEMTVPKRWFWHFYLLGLLSISLVLFDMFFMGGSLVIEQVQACSVCSEIATRTRHAQALGVESFACLMLLLVHVCRRLWECLVITRWGFSRMSWAGYLAGVVHYQLLVLTIIVEAPRLTSVGGDFLKGFKAGEGLDVGRRLVENMEFHHLVGLGLFVVATARQHETIRYLASLRDPPSKEEGAASSKASSNTYALPTQGWFQYVSCPHYLAEVLIYASFWLIAGSRRGTLGQGYQLVVTWVFSNQAFVAARVHAWYQQKFENYPRRRKRLVPGIW